MGDLIMPIEHITVFKGESARVFNEYIEDPNPQSTPESRALIERAKRLTQVKRMKRFGDRMELEFLLCLSLVFAMFGAYAYDHNQMFLAIIGFYSCPILILISLALGFIVSKKR